MTRANGPSPAPWASGTWPRAANGQQTVSLGLLAGPCPLTAMYRGSPCGGQHQPGCGAAACVVWNRRIGVSSQRSRLPASAPRKARPRCRARSAAHGGAPLVPPSGHPMVPVPGTTPVAPLARGHAGYRHSRGLARCPMRSWRTSFSFVQLLTSTTTMPWGVTHARSNSGSIGAGSRGDHPAARTSSASWFCSWWWARHPRPAASGSCGVRVVRLVGNSLRRAQTRGRGRPPGNL
jgi:hypothetical protein